ncbi:alpha/beta fold hydrolase [Rhizobium leguminosarum]|uniref:alpha/beta fold hydrolase n=1 Tax=Rhizobium leguminosarum TaxID=384 RepID=UPI0021B0C102|nr:alpha/beta hydrolase [Rhizobium leguminosarum]MBY2910178.1 alpha/beta hydrolase [Rhizobium leguminosarum]
MTTDREFSRRSFLGFAGGAIAMASLPAGAIAATPQPAQLFATEAGKGRNVMLLHGWTADGEDWSWQLPVLEARYRTVTVDLRGHGRSPVPPSGHYRPADYVADIEALLVGRYKGERFILIGHSMGGQIAARLAARNPDLVEAVVSVDGSLGFAKETVPLFGKVTRDLQTGNPAVIAPALFESVYDTATPTALRRWHARRVQGMPAHVVRESFGPLFVGPGQVGTGAQSEKFLRTIKTPFYHLCRDPAQAQRMQPWFSHPASKVDAWDRAGHWIMQDRPDDVNAAITAWIDRI